MSAKTPIDLRKTFDPAKFETMLEPFSVRVEKVRGGIRSPVPLPDGENGEEPGTNWSKSDVRGIEKWLVNEWTGGGAYSITAIDSTEPTPQKMEWSSFYPVTDFPERIPPTLAGGAAPNRVITQLAKPIPQPQAPQANQMSSSHPSAFPNGFPAGYQPPTTPTQVAIPPQQIVYAQPQQNPYRGNQAVDYTNQLSAELRQQLATAEAERKQAAAASDAERKALADQLKEMQLQLNKSKEDSLIAQHRQDMMKREAELKMEQQINADRISKLESLIEKSIANSQAQAAAAATAAAQAAAAAHAKPSGPDPMLEAMKEQNRVLAEKAENERREREADKREQALRDQMRQSQENFERQVREQAEQARRDREAMEKQLLALTAAANQPKGPDPILTFMQESMRSQQEQARIQADAGKEAARIQAEATKEAARSQAEAAKAAAQAQQLQMAEMKGFMMSPRDMMAMAKESNQGVDQATRQITNTYQDILQMQRSVVEQMLQMQGGGGNETAQMIEKGLERASSFAERFIGAKSKEAIAAQQSQATMAQAQAQAMTAQAMAMQAQQRAGVATTQPPNSGLNGAATQRPVTQAQPQTAPPPSPIASIPQNKPPKAPEPPKQDAWSVGPVPPTTLDPNALTPKRHGKTDEQWFTQALPRVLELRTGVDRFMESIAMNPPRLNPETATVDGIEPGQAADFIQQAVGFLAAQKIAIPAMVELLSQGRFGEFMDCLLPNAPQAYRDEVVAILLSPDNDDDDVDDDDDDDDDGGQPPPGNPGKNGQRALA